MCHLIVSMYRHALMIYSCFTTAQLTTDFIFYLFLSHHPYSSFFSFLHPTDIKIMSALATQSTSPTDSVAHAISSWIQSIADIDTQVAAVRARREAAEADTSEASDAIEDECHAALCRLKKERREIGVQVTSAMHDLSALAENSGFAVVSSSSSAALSSPTSSGETKTTDGVAVAVAAEVATPLTAKDKEEIAVKLGVAVAEIVSLSLLI